MLAERDEMVMAYWGKLPTVDEVRAHLANHQRVPVLAPLRKPCHDCAVTNGFYAPIAAALSMLPPNEVAQRSSEWFCHNNCNRACAGNIEYQNSIAAFTG